MSAGNSQLRTMNISKYKEATAGAFITYESWRALTMRAFTLVVIAHLRDATHVAGSAQVEPEGVEVFGLKTDLSTNVNALKGTGHSTDVKVIYTVVLLMLPYYNTRS